MTLEPYMLRFIYRLCRLCKIRINKNIEKTLLFQLLYYYLIIIIIIINILLL